MRAARGLGGVVAFACAIALAPVALAGSAPAARVGETGDVDGREADAAVEAYDPFAGIDQDGRIPGVARPSDLPNPERWRYIPEGRIKPGNMLERFLVSSFFAPFFTQDEDVGTGFGVAITDIDFRQRRRREFAGIFLSYSTEGEQDYSIVWQRWLHHVERAGGGVFQEERSRVRVSAGYEKTLTKRFFGFGPATKERQETSYEDEEFEVDVGLQIAWPEPGDDLILGGGVRASFHELAGGAISDVPQTNCGPVRADPTTPTNPGGNCFPSVFAEAEHANLGWLYSEIRYDTRDSQANPYRGWTLGASIDFAPLQSGGDVGARYSLGGSIVFPMPGLFHHGAVGDEEHPPTDTVAFGADLRLSSGDLPFFERPALGGRNRLRGFIDGRFRDDAAWWAGAEYRFWVLPRGFAIPFTRALRVERVGLAPFYEVGSVGGGLRDLANNRVHHSYGVGLRITLERQAPFRVDVGFSDEDTIVIARFGLPF
ncbi:MAG: BamA/TamA family outer membrane protein [Myxococcales bacterium]|nr:BamA/TamA family outer membrane protein [Myxococcales bacterium]